jgi:RNA polymerase sigma-70 factor (ECF subfamily)
MPDSIASLPGRPDTARHMAPADFPGSLARDDADLMLAYARGDAGTFEQLYARHKGPTYRYFLRHLGGRTADAAELHQDLWLKVVGARHRYAATAKFTTWLYTLARHRLIDYWRADGTAGFTSLDDAAEIDALAANTTDDTLGEPLRVTMHAQHAERLLAALRDVPAAQRDAFLLHVEGGLALAEIAALTGDPEQTIKSRLRYAYRKLRAALEDLQ